MTKPTFVLSPLGELMIENRPEREQPEQIQPIARVHEVSMTARTVSVAEAQAITKASRAYGKPAMKPWVRTIVPVFGGNLYKVTVAYVTVL